MEYRYSMYNVLLTEKDRRYLWNTYSNFVVDLDEETYERLLGTASHQLIDESFPYFKIMKDDGFIVDAELDEAGRVMADYRGALFEKNTGTLSLTIAPGMNCNYHCLYCFEDGKRCSSSMSDQKIAELTEYVRKCIAENKNLKELHITWFGGEPLLYVDVIEKLSDSLISLCDENGIKYSAGIITNARFLTTENAERLVRRKVKVAQVSIDGMEQLYCRNKVATPEDFNAVVQNICDVSRMMNIAVRINVSPEEYAEACELTGYLLKDKGLDGIIKIYIANKRLYSGTVAAERENFKSFCELDSEYRRMFDNVRYSSRSYQFKLVKKTNLPCSNISCSAFCIGPEGEMYMCEHYFGDSDEVVGHIDRGLLHNETERKYMSCKLPLDACMSCTHLPCCMGGCPDDIASGRFIIDCDAYKGRLNELKLFEIRERIK